eukprot:scaffold512387_cov50-Prasinocladus_malaysianus.AAC.2
MAPDSLVITAHNCSFGLQSFLCSACNCWSCEMPMEPLYFTQPSGVHCASTYINNKAKIDIV